MSELMIMSRTGLFWSTIGTGVLVYEGEDMVGVVDEGDASEYKYVRKIRSFHTVN